MKMLALVLLSMFTLGLFAGNSIAHAAGSDITVTLSGSSHYLATYVIPGHGKLTSIETYYSLDHYDHIDSLVRAPNVRDIQMYTCINPESTLPGRGQCDDHINAADIDTVGLLGQPHTGVHHNVTLTFTPAGSGFSMHQGHFEHGGEPRMEFHYADGFTLTVLMPSAPHLFAINMYRAYAPNSVHSGAVFTGKDSM